jgi:hypothetical protein
LNSRAQLRLLLTLCEKANIARGDISLFDPDFNNEDEAELKALGLTIITENLWGKYPIQEPTVLFMPHCGISLYENVLRANWKRRNLRDSIFIGNEFQTYIDNTPRAKLESRTPCLARITPHVQSHVLPPCGTHPMAFNDLAIQTMGQHARTEQGESQEVVNEYKELPSDDDDAFWRLPDEDEVVQNKEEEQLELDDDRELK